MQKKPLSMTVIRNDVSSIDAVISYSNAANRSEFIKDFVLENYGAASPLVLSMTKIAFKEAMELH